MSNKIEQLPTLGIGASLSLSAKPDPVSLVQARQGPSFVEYAGLADVDDVIDEIDRIKSIGVPVLFHPSYINFCGSYSNSKHWLEATALQIKKVGSPWFAQDCAYCFWEEGPGYSSQFGYFIPPILNKASLKRAIERVREVQAIIPVTVAIEPPPVTFVVGSISVFSFFGELADQTDCAILLDMGHLVSYEMANGKAVTDALQALPQERVIEVHIAGGRIKEDKQGSVYIDAHEWNIQDQTWQMLDRMLPELPNVKAVCFECEGVDEKIVLSTLKRLRKKVREKSISKELITSLDTTA
ncbi:MAG: hypothetical protein ACI9XC_000544 [Gammaproteobacteria bacterium]|jgi:uncharacterized protein (UPF0276 family)